MENRLKDKFVKEVVEVLLSRFGIEACEAELMGSHQSFVYKGYSNNQNKFIRITLSTHRTYEEINSELEIMKYLSIHGLDVVLPLLSRNREYIEEVRHGEDTFYAVAFTEAVGGGIGGYPWSWEVPFRVGKMTGNLHDLLKKYKLDNVNRPIWNENTFIADAKSYLTIENEKVLARLSSLIDELKQIPITTENYGLIHGDLVACNYHMRDDSITLFDFDEMSYCWYLNDIAISTFYSSLTWQGDIDIEGSKKSFIKFMEGYLKYTTVSDDMIKKLPLFLKLREIILYVSIHRSRDLSKLDQWTYKFMLDRKEKIEQNIPFVDIEFERL